MGFFARLGLIYFILPFIFVVKNKISLLSSIMFGQKYTIQIRDNTKIEFDKQKFDIMLSFLGILTYATSFDIIPDRKIRISFDMDRNSFTIPLDNMSLENENLILTLFGGLRHGADFVINDDCLATRDKSFKIKYEGGKKIIETNTGIKFYLDSIHPGNTIVETFVQDIHATDSEYDWNDKIVIDAGAECGDTPLYYASKGAIVYAFEPMKAHFDAMMRNLSLNPELAKRITPINAGIGKDGTLSFYHSNRADIAESSSFVYNTHGDNAKIFHVKCFSVKSAIKDFNIDHVDLLKMDCKGCEYFITKNDLVDVSRVKIEYEALDYVGHTVNELLQILRESNFDYKIYRTNPNRDRLSNKITAHLYGQKTQN